MAYQLYDFLTTGPGDQLSLVGSANRHVIGQLVYTRLWPPRTLVSLSGPRWPPSWESENLKSLQQALRELEKGTWKIQKALRLPPSTGITPAASPTSLRETPSALNQPGKMADSGSSDPLNSTNLPDKETLFPEMGESSRAAGKRAVPRADTADYVAGQVEAITGVKKSAGNPNYTKNNYSRDCLAVLLIAGRIAKNEPGYDLPFIRGSITNTDVGAAQAIYRLSSETKRKALQTEADQQLLSSDSASFILGDRDVFQAWISRVREGPGEPGALDLTSETIEEVTSSRRPSPEQRRYTEERPNLFNRPERRPGQRRYTPLFSQPEPRPETRVEERPHVLDERRKFLRELRPASPQRNWEQEDQEPRREVRPYSPRRPNWDHEEQEPRRNMHEYQRNPEPQGLGPDLRRPAAEDNELAYLRARVAQQDAELRRSRLPEPGPEFARRSRLPDPGPEFVPRENRRLESLTGRRNERYDYPPPMPMDYGQDERRPRNLRPAEIMMFDPQKQSAAFFIRRFRHIAELEGSGPVLRILPMCLEKDALEWHNGLSSRVRQEMNHDLSVWEDELLREYRPNRFESLKKAENMKFRFEDSSTTLSQYLTRKTNHLHDAGIEDEDMIVRYLWQGLEANLALATPMREEGDTIENFNRRVRNNEAAAKRVHELNKPRTKSQPTTANPARVQRLFGNLAAKGWTQAAETKPKPKATSQAKVTKPKKPLEASKAKGNVRPKRSPPRPCRHCGADHWDNDCTSDKKTDDKKVLKVEEMEVEDMDVDEGEWEGEENEEEDLFDPYDTETYAALEALAEEESRGEILQDS